MNPFSSTPATSSRWSTRTIQHHTEALALSAQFDGRPVVVTDAVLLGIGNALSRMNRDTAVQIIQDLRESSEVTVVNLTPELFESAFELYRRHTDKQWGRVDCVSFVVMRRMELKIALAFDQHFVQAGFVVPRL